MAALIAAGAIGLVLHSSAQGSRRALLQSIFQDDDHLLYAPTPVVQRTLDQLRRLGVDRLRLTILWAAIAPEAASRRPPAHFRARDPAAYAATAWFAYDRIALLARESGIGVAFNVTAPGPLWAMGSPAPSAKIANHLRPSPTAFGDFVTAVGRRYDGHYAVPTPSGRPITLPRVDYWTVWNEPNQPGWLYPQWRRAAGHWVMDSPRLYRLYVDAAFSALGRTGHTPGRDTILIGELAPEGSESSSEHAAIPPLPFIRALYCVDDSFRPLRGPAAALLHCPAGGDGAAFVRAHPGLFRLTGFAHHPYSFFLAPTARFPDPNFAPLSQLSGLEAVLDRSLSTYGVSRRLPIYLTEYGYETYPPNPFRGVSLVRQALYLQQAQYMAAGDGRVRAMAQFLLVDALPDSSYPRGSERYWSTFQTGLRFASRGAKPSLFAYRLPIFLPHPVLTPGSPLLVWGMLRPAPNSTTQSALIQWRGAHGRFRTLERVSTSDPSGILSANVDLPGPGAVRIAWTSPQGELVHSLAVRVTTH